MKRDESTGALVVARIMRGGAADLSGKKHFNLFLKLTIVSLTNTLKKFVIQFDKELCSSDNHLYFSVYLVHKK